MLHLPFNTFPAVHDKSRLISHLLTYLVAYIENKVDPGQTDPL